MNIRARATPNQQMTVEEFLAFTASRPDEERWELIEGVPVLNASPIDVHQLVVANIVTVLMQLKESSGATWLPMLGVGTRVPASPDSLPRPDVFVKEGPPTGKPFTDDALVVFEILSRSNRKADRDWRKRVYGSVANCRHYVTVSMQAPEIIVCDRARDWKEQRVKGLDATVSLPAIGAEVTLERVYRWTPLAGERPE